MKNILRKLAAAAAILTALFATPAFADGAVALSLGGRTMNNEAYWDPVDDQGRVAVSFDYAVNPQVPLWLSVSGGYSNNDDGISTASGYTSIDIWDATLGLKLMPQNGVVRPYVGAGVMRSWAELTLDTDTDSDISRGWYVDGGAMFWIGRHANVTVNLRWVKDTQVVLYGQEGDLDSKTVTVGGGFTWGGPSRPRRHHRSPDEEG